MSTVLESILTFLKSLGIFIENLVNGFIQLVQMIPKALYFLGISMSALPQVLTVFAVAFISVSVVYLIIGR